MINFLTKVQDIQIYKILNWRSMAAMQKLDQKLQRKTFYSFKRQNFYDYIKSSSKPNISYKITATGIGKISSLKAKLEVIVGNIFDEGDSKSLHPAFDYVIRRLVHYESINSNKRTEYRMIVGNQMSTDLNNQNLQSAIKKRVEQIINELNRKQIENENYKFQRNEPRKNKLIKFLQNIKDFQNKLRVELKEYNKRLIKTKNDENFLWTDEYFEELIKNLNKIQLLRISQQSIKYNTFEKRNKEYFEVSLAPEKNKNIQLKICRPSSQIQPLLQTVADLVRRRDREVSYRSESSIMIKDIFEQLKQYEYRNSTENFRSIYEFLQPSSIIFDQISLSPKLSFEPLILNLFGVKDKPMSIQNRIVFHPTPEGFDYFRSLPEFDAEKMMILKDPFYGNIDLYDSDKYRMNQQQTRQIEEESYELLQLKQEMLAQRFLLTSYYLMESEEYGFKPDLKSNKEKTNYYISKMQEMKQSLSKDMSKLCLFMGSSNQFVENRPFNFRMNGISEFLSIQNDDSVVQNNKYMMIRKYFQTRNFIIKEFIRLLVNDKIFGKIYNIKKYIFLYLAIAIEILEQARRFIYVEKLQSKERKKLRIYLEKQLKRLRSDKNHFGYLQTTYQKIEVYCNRSPDKDHQAKFAKEEELGKKAIGFVNEINEDLKKLQGDNDALNQLETKETLSSEDRDAYAELMKNVDEIVKKYAEKIRGILNQFIFSELRLKHRDGPHRLSEESIKRQSYAMYTNRLELLTLTYISMDEQNFITYDTLIVPLFRIEDNEKKFEIPRNLDLESEVNNLKIVSELIDSNKLLPKKMVYLSSRASNDEMRLYNQRNNNRRSQSIEFVNPYTNQNEIQFKQKRKNQKNTRQKK